MRKAVWMAVTAGSWSHVASVRNTWELNPDQFELRNPEWNDYVKGIVQCVGDELGVNAPFSAQLYKTLLYSKDAMLKSHTE